MSLHRTLRTLATVTGFAAITAAAALGVAWPHTTYADGAAVVVQYTPEGTRIADVLVKGNLVRDANAKSGWVVVVTAENKSAQAETVLVETDITRTVSQPMARVMPVPQTAWSTTEQVTLAAHQKITKRYEVPAALASQIAASMKPAPQNGPPSVDMSRTTTRYAVLFKSPATAKT